MYGLLNPEWVISHSIFLNHRGDFMKLILALSFLVTSQAFALVPGVYTGEVEGKKVKAVVEGKKEQSIRFLDVCAPKNCSTTYKVLPSKNSNKTFEYGKLSFDQERSNVHFLELTSYKEQPNKRPGFEVKGPHQSKITFWMK